MQIETPKKCTTTMTVYVGSECDASMPNGTQARENHVGRLGADRLTIPSFLEKTRISLSRATVLRQASTRLNSHRTSLLQPH